MGTPAFMSPEQAGGRTKEIDARTDVWSAGALLFVLLTRPARSITSVMPDLSGEVAVAMRNALRYAMGRASVPPPAKPADEESSAMRRELTNLPRRTAGAPRRASLS